MPNAAHGKETLPVAVLESQQLDPADTKDVVQEPLPAQKVLKIFSINIIAQGLPFCRRRVSVVYLPLYLCTLVSPLLFASSFCSNHSMRTSICAHAFSDILYSLTLV